MKNLAQLPRSNSFFSLNCESLEPRLMLSNVQLIAGGFEGIEQIELQIDQVAVETWTLNNTGAQGIYQTLNYQTSEKITADQIRIEFINDQWDPINNIDANVRIDAIFIDGVRFETEDPSVYSTGTWLPDDGVQPGFRTSEFLHTNGYFQFANTIVPPNDVTIVINEIHYNPGPDGIVDPDAEFIELYNAGAEDADLSGMSFVGFDLTFVAGTILGAGQYAIVSPSIAIAQSTWGVTPIAQFASGGLSGSGETIQLIAADGMTVIDEVTYDDAAPWPGAPDGNGPSLELLDPTLDNSDPANWAVSIGNPTPAAENSVFGDPQVPPIEIVVTTDPLPDQPIDITATIQGATTAQLIYRIGFGPEITVEMINLGGDQWQATIAGQEAGALVRYRIDSDVAIAPFLGDTINYFGVIVQPTDIVENDLPVFQFFVDDAQFQELTTTDLVLTNTQIPAVVAWDGQVYDNVQLSVRGGDYSRQFYPKKSLKFELPDGYTLDFGTGYGVDEFGVNADFGDWTFAATTVSWEIWNKETTSQTQAFNMRVENNGQFHGVFRFQELYDGAWRDFNGFGNDQFYQAEAGAFGETPQFDKKDPEDGDFAPITLINDALTKLSPGSAEQRDWLYRNVDIPAVINHMALSAMMRHDDQKFQNFYMAISPDTQLWTIVEWDLDRLWINNENSPTDFTDVSYIDAPLLNAVFAVPEFEAMYWRRMQTLVDTYLSPAGQADLITRRNQIINEIGATNSTLEFNKWGRVDIYASQYFADEWVSVLAARATAFANEVRMPGTASGNSPIVINELHYNPLDGDAEFIELYNDSDESVDLSGWSIDGVNLQIPFGTIILPHQYVVFTDNRLAFNAQSAGNVFVAGQYSGGLSGSGEAITLYDASGNIVDFVQYDDAAPWSTEPDGDGFTLALIDSQLDNSLAESWQASAQINGTPGKANDSVQSKYELTILAAGAFGKEIITLEIAGKQVATFYLDSYGVSAGDLYVGNFTTLRWLSEQPIDISDVRINFVNDLYDAEKGIDYGVAIDRVEIDGVIFETEAPEVYSTGTWIDGQGIVAGFQQTQLLNSNGYLQYGVVQNNPPTAVEDVFSTVYLTAISGNVLVNDSDDDNDPLLATLIEIPSHGSIVFNSTGQFTYTPSSGFSGTDTFTYLIDDGNGATASATVTIDVGPAPLFSDGNIIQLLNVGYNAWLTSSGNLAVTSRTNNSATQWRLLDPDGDGLYRLQNIATGRYLDGDSLSVDTTTNMNETGTLWRFVAAGAGQYYLSNDRYNRFVDADGTSTRVDWEYFFAAADDRWVVSAV